MRYLFIAMFILSALAPSYAMAKEAESIDHCPKRTCAEIMRMAEATRLYTAATSRKMIQTPSMPPECQEIPA